MKGSKERYEKALLDNEEQCLADGNSGKNKFL